MILARNRLYMYVLFFFSPFAGFIQVQHSFYLNLQSVDAFLIPNPHSLIFTFYCFQELWLHYIYG